MKMVLVMAAAGTIWAAVARAADFEAFPEVGATLVSREGAEYLTAEPAAWGPGWSYMGFRGKVTAAEGVTRQSLGAKDKKGGAVLNLESTSQKTGARQIALDYRLSTPKDARLVYAVVGLAPGSALDGGQAVVTRADGTSETLKLPLGRGSLGKGVRKVVLTDPAGVATTLSFEPAAEIGMDGALRVILAGSTFKAAEPAQQRVTVDLPGDVTYYPTVQDVPDIPGLAQWFEWKPAQDYAQPSAIAMDDWSPERAGARGRVVRKGQDLLYGGRPAKFWGLNLCYRACAPEKEMADRQAAFYRKYGINTVRLHKYADGAGWSGIQSADSAAEFDPAGLDRMDYLVARLIEAGIFVKLSAQFGVIAIGPQDVRDVPYAEEFGKLGGKKGGRIATPASAFAYSPEVQNLHIRQIANLLAHKNPYTGRTYADEPGLLAIEIINENSVLFYSSMSPLRASATLRGTVGKRFCDFLRKRYGGKDALLAAWGDKAFNSFGAEGFAKEGEDLDRGNILPIGNPWFWDPANLNGSQAFRRRRLLDSLEFLHDLQVEAYGRWVEAVRKAGYAGEILASNWQAGQNTSHYYNLHTDYTVGLIDRHNYFGGSRSMLAVPGGGMLSAGMQQVADRPFMLSEWIHTFPGEWHAEGPAIIAAYGMGLQDWDVSYIFQNSDPGGFIAELGKSKWEVTAPQMFALFPALSRQVRRQDVKAADVVAPRYVHVPSLRDEKLGFNDGVAQDYDIKSFDSDKVPARSLAVARCVVEFTDAYRETPAFDAEAHRRDGDYVSATGQLRWTPGANAYDGRFTMDTPATKAVVGFAAGKTCALAGVAITPRTPFAAIYVTARGPGEDLRSARSALVVAVARARNTGMKYLDGKRLLARGGPPILMEPVKAEIRLDRAAGAVVHVLDQDGKRTGQTLPVAAGAFTIDGASTRTAYYEIAWE
jgi:hypothetical protein